jgi:hypothetical protein
MSDLFHERVAENNPKVLLRQDDPVKNDFTFRVQERVGWFYRVIPSSAKDVAYLRSLQKGYDYFAPAEGDGLIVSAHAIPV